MRRVNVKGTSGSGKTTFGLELAERLGVPFLELDALHWVNPSWQEPADERFREDVRAALGAMPHGWVIDGNYERKLDDLVLRDADTIVWLDLPLRVKLRRVWRRTVARIRDEQELWGGNRESWHGAFWGRDSLLGWMLRTHFSHRRDWPERYGGDPRFVRLRSVAEARRWLDSQAP